MARARTTEQLDQLVDAWEPGKNEVYFDRDPAPFNLVLDFYRTERLHTTEEVGSGWRYRHDTVKVCVMDFAEELHFWMIRDFHMEVCCAENYNLRRAQGGPGPEREEEQEEEEWGEGCLLDLQRRLWHLFDRPQSSLAAKLVSLFSILMVLVSTLAMCLNTLPSLQVQVTNSRGSDLVMLCPLLCSRSPWTPVATPWTTPGWL